MCHEVMISKYEVQSATADIIGDLAIHSKTPRFLKEVERVGGYDNNHEKVVELLFLELERANNLHWYNYLEEYITCAIKRIKNMAKTHPVKFITMLNEIANDIIRIAEDMERSVPTSHLQIKYRINNLINKYFE